MGGRLLSGLTIGWGGVGVGRVGGFGWVGWGGIGGGGWSGFGWVGWGELGCTVGYGTVR